MSKLKNVRKEKIMRTAARLFSEKGYEAVTTREITSAAGINPAALYYYFQSKDDLLKSLYDFYHAERRVKRHDLGELLLLAETGTPHEVLTKVELRYSDEIRDLMDQILVIAAWNINNDEKSERFIRESIFEDIEVTLRVLLRRLVDLGKIKPFDLDTFLRVLSYYCFSAVVLNNTAFKSSFAEYQTGMSLIFALLTPTEEAGGAADGLPAAG